MEKLYLKCGEVEMRIASLGEMWGTEEIKKGGK